MKICDVVLDTIWYDPRVRKQLIGYTENGDTVTAVGLMDIKYNEGKIKDLPCVTVIADFKKDGLLKIPVIGGIVRKLRTNHCVEKAILGTGAELIHANDLTALIPAFFASRKMKAVLVYDAHEINTENYSRKRKVLYSVCMKAIERFLVRRVDLMVSVSHAAASYFAATYRIPEPLVVTNCARRDAMQCDDREKHPGFEVLNHGQFYNGRGYDIMVKACAALKAYPGVTLAVRGYGVMEPYLHEAAAKLENKEQFVFYPPVDTKDLISYASASHVGVAVTEPISLNFRYSVSNKIFEYAAAGLPVIMSDIPEHRYLNEKYDFGIILKENTPECFAEAVLRLRQDTALYRRCSENAREMTKQLNWETEFRKLTEREKNIMEGKING